MARKNSGDKVRIAKKGKKTSIGRGKGSKFPHNPRNKKYRKKYRGQGKR